MLHITDSKQNSCSQNESSNNLNWVAVGTVRALAEYKQTNKHFIYRGWSTSIEMDRCGFVTALLLSIMTGAKKTKSLRTKQHLNKPPKLSLRRPSPHPCKNLYRMLYPESFVTQPARN